MLAAEKACAVPIFPSATASTSRPTLAAPGSIWVNVMALCATPQQIASILVDPKDANRVFVAALGHPYGPNAERGVFRSLDGGQTLAKSSL